jgi:hypothetical protein
MNIPILNMLYFFLFCLQHPKQSNVKRDMLLKPTLSLLIITGQKDEGDERDKEYVGCSETFKPSEAMDQIQHKKQRIFKQQGWTPLELNPKRKSGRDMKNRNRTIGYYQGGLYYVLFLRDRRDSQNRHYVWGIHVIATKLKLTNTFDYFKEYSPAKKKR